MLLIILLSAVQGKEKGKFSLARLARIILHFDCQHFLNSMKQAKNQILLLHRVLVMALAVLACEGCVRRKLTITSRPPGARVFVNDRQIGVTPVEMDFTYYAAQEIRLKKDGYKTVVIHKQLDTPYYQWIGFDFVSENLIPADIEDQHDVGVALVPYGEPDSDGLLERAEAAKARVNEITPWKPQRRRPRRMRKCAPISEEESAEHKQE